MLDNHAPLYPLARPLCIADHPSVQVRKDVLYQLRGLFLDNSDLIDARGGRYRDLNDAGAH